MNYIRRFNEVGTEDIPLVGDRGDPDKFLVLKDVLETARVSIISKGDQGKYSLTDEEFIELARWFLIIEEYYSTLNMKDTPLDFEWAKDGATDELYILQARKHVGICDQAPSDYPEIVSFLEDLGIDSISLSPDSVLKVLTTIKEAETKRENANCYF
jgi:phosphoenolpyruvate synthase/pyruvate phosphate dikinase